jgi:hypothetical protein
MSFRQGDIVWAPVTPDAGPVKPRRAIILTPTAEIEATGSAVVIGVTGSFQKADVSRYFSVPWNIDGNVTTGFKKPSAASRTLVQRFPVAALNHTSPETHLPKLKLLQLIAWLSP